MSSYNLDDSEQAESFDFILGGRTYHFRYPTTEEVIQLAQIAKAAPDDPAKALEPVYAFVTTDDENAPPIEDVLNKSSVLKLKAFQNMIITEIGLQA